MNHITPNTIPHQTAYLTISLSQKQKRGLTLQGGTSFKGNNLPF
jgi:hypothetical protein